MRRPPIRRRAKRGPASIDWFPHLRHTNIFEEYHPKWAEKVASGVIRGGVWCNDGIEDVESPMYDSLACLGQSLRRGKPSRSLATEGYLGNVRLERWYALGKKRSRKEGQGLEPGSEVLSS
ncbi:hypothetical protein AFLA_006921 [Aspergillus flavus NRRL3357]|nr:hypothetical protein AFLA_006921 [Aspergillus flavus NRRL3357]